MGDAAVILLFYPFMFCRSVARRDCLGAKRVIKTIAPGDAPTNQDPILHQSFAPCRLQAPQQYDL